MISLEVHTTFCVQIGGKSRIVCVRVVSHGQSSVERYEHFARLRRRGAIGCMPLYAQTCNATFSARLDTESFSMILRLGIILPVVFYEKKIIFYSWQFFKKNWIFIKSGLFFREKYSVQLYSFQFFK